MKIALGEFKDDGAELAEFLEPRIGVKPKSSGDGLEIDDDSVRKSVKPRHVKTYIKRFLLKKDLRKRYKVIVEGTELTMIYLEAEEEEKEKEEKKREEEKVKREEQSKKEAPTPEETKEADESAKANNAKEDALSVSKEQEKEEGSLKEEPAKKQRKPRKKSD